MARPVTIRTARPSDVAAIARVDAESWPAPLAATEDQVRARLLAYPAGQFVAELDGEIVGVVFAQRVTDAFFATTLATFDELTDHGRFTASHDGAGAIYQIVGVGVATAARGLKLGRQLVDRQIEHARSLSGIRRILGFTRPAEYHRRPELSIDDYVELRDAHGARLDRVLSFHLDNSAQLVSVHPAFRPADAESLGFGVLIEYPIR